MLHVNLLSKKYMYKDDTKRKGTTNENVLHIKQEI